MPQALEGTLCPFDANVISPTLGIVEDEVGGVSPQATANGDDGSGNGGESDQHNELPDYKTQKTEIHAVLQQRLKQGETW